MKENKSNRRDTLGTLSISIDESFSLDDLFYVASRTKSINFLQERLFNIYEWTYSKKTKSYTAMAKFNAVPFSLMPLLKTLGYCDSNCNWIINNHPTKADAVFIALKLRDYNRKRKSKSN